MFVDELGFVSNSLLFDSTNDSIYEESDPRRRASNRLSSSASKEAALSSNSAPSVTFASASSSASRNLGAGASGLDNISLAHSAAAANALLPSTSSPTLSPPPQMKKVQSHRGRQRMVSFDYLQWNVRTSIFETIPIVLFLVSFFLFYF
jgi:hypothetical protein